MTAVQKIERYARALRDPKLLNYLSNRKLRHPRVRSWMADATARLTRLRTGKAGAALSPEEQQRLRTFRENGHLSAGVQLSGAQIQDVLSFLEGRPVYDKWNPAAGEFLPDDAPEGANVLDYPVSTILDTPHLMEIANDPQNLAFAEAFLGCKPTISILALWWSPTSETAQRAQLFHRDFDDWRFLKLFVYLTDVDDASGPHVYVQGSAQQPNFLQVRRYSDEEVVGYYGKQAVQRLTGPAGNAYWVNTSGIHKGEPPRERRRLLFQVEYAISPKMKVAYSPRPVPYERAKNWDRFTNRLFVDWGEQS